jgi:hypothetical protein
MKVVGNFKRINFLWRTPQLEFACSRNRIFTKESRISFVIPKVGDVIDSKSCHMWWFDHRSVCWTCGDREESKSPWIKGVRSHGQDEVSNTIYWWETLFWEAASKSHEFASPLAAIYKKGGRGWRGLISITKNLQGRRGPRAAGATLLRAATAVAASLAVAVSPPWWGTSPSPSTTLLHHIPTVFPWQTWCFMQYIISPWCIVSLCLVLSCDLFMGIVK